MFRNARTTAVWTLGILAVAALAAGQVILPVPPPEMPPGDRIPQLLEVRSLHVKVEIGDASAETELDQVFHNPTRHRLEGTYIFPLPPEAAVTDFALYIGDERVEAELLDRDEATRIYEEIVRNLRDPALLTYAGDRLLRARIFPIEPRSERRIVLRYSHPLAWEGGLREYRLPLMAAGAKGGRIGELSLEAEIESSRPLKAVYSPTHDVDVDRRGELRAEVGFEAKSHRPDRDFLLYMSSSREMVGVDLLAHRPGGRDGYFVMIVAPRLEVAKRERGVRDVVFVFDTSGSMQGEKIEQARNALAHGLQTLQEGDRFGIVSFSTGVRTLDPELLSVTRETRARAREFIEKMQARGGTNIAEALPTALEMFGKDAVPDQVVFLTDGRPTVGSRVPKEILEKVREANDTNARIFPWGVGYDVNAQLLDALASENRGAAAYVTPGENLEVRLSAFFGKMTDPVLQEPKLRLDGIEVKESYPSPLPDLFAGEQLLVVGRYEGSGRSSVRLSGRVGEETRTFRYEATFPRRESDNDFVPRLWATRRVGHLLGEIRLHGEEGELKEEVIRLSKRYGILTPYTGYLVLEDEPSLIDGGFRQAPQEEAARERREAMAGVFHGRQKRTTGDVSSVSAPPASGKDQVRASQGVQEYKAAVVDGPADAVSVRYLAGKTFQKQGDRWADTDYHEDLPSVRVTYGSREYFDLLRERKELRRFLSLGEQVTVVLDGVAYIVESETE